ncbi:MAG: ribD [Phycisphaerales bacterium]|nr:ribD [Phycisphaerales bacterium]
MLSPFDETMLRRALRVAMNGRGRVEPNPMVGCVLVKNDQIIAEGHHTHFGGPHAEPAALTDCAARGNDPRGATAYVTLEPCCHTNKKTPPCAPRLIEAGVARAVIGCLDPNPDVDGKGIAMLRAAGIEVVAAPPPLAAEFLQLIAPFRMPPFYTTLKWAQSADGYVAGAGGMPVRISGPQANLAVHRLRTRCDSIVISSRTAEMDDPSLTVRGVEIIRRPTRIILDRSLRTPLTGKLFGAASPTATGQAVVILTDFEQFDPMEAGAETEFAESPARGLSQKVLDFREQGARVIGISAPDLLSTLISSAVVPNGSHVLIEPGPRLAAAALPWADRLWVIHSSTPLDAGPSAPEAAAVSAAYVETGRLTLGNDTLVEYLNRNAASFVAATPSADFVLEFERATQA